MGREWKSEGVMDGEIGESMEEEEETDVRCGVSKSLRLPRGCRIETGSRFQR